MSQKPKNEKLKKEFLLLSICVSGWGHPYYGCADNSDKTKDANSSNVIDPCGGKEFTYYDFGLPKSILKNGTATWNWYHCEKAGKCIPEELRCDFRPHPDCIVQIVTKEGNMTIAEDEEGCPNRKNFLSSEQFSMLNNCSLQNESLTFLVLERSKFSKSMNFVVTTAKEFV